VLAGCGGDGDDKGAVGTASNPLPAQTPDAERGASREPGSSAKPEEAPSFEKLLDQQTKNPRERFTPCNLVTPAQARTILGGPIEAPVEAPQGPTCIYRTKAGDKFVTVAVQATRLAALRKQMDDVRTIAVADRDAICGMLGQQALYVPLAEGRVLAVTGRCPVAARFAERAVRELTA